MLRRGGRAVALWGWCAAWSVLSTGAAAHHNQTEDLLDDEEVYEFSSFYLELRPYVQMPAESPNIISMTTRLGENALYVTTQEGRVHKVVANTSGTAERTEFLHLGDVGAGGVALFGTNGQQGLQSIAFHPEFDQVGMPGYGKLYATMTRTHSTTASFLGSTPRAVSAPDGVLAEWTYDHSNGTVSGYRELLRVNMPVNDHPIKQARFNPYAKPGDEDYGLLYMTHGDSNTQQSTEDYPQYLDNALGKMIRINPLDPDGDGEARYSIPTTNPFYNYGGPTPAGHPNVLGEIYSYGFRNPHNYSFNKDDNGDVHILVGNIGRANVEEVELARPGHNYGWPNREGTFIEKQVSTSGAPNPGLPGSNYGYIEGVSPLPADEANLMDGYEHGNTYPVSQYDHNAAYAQYSSDSSIASGFVIRNGSDPNLQNQLIFNNFPEHDSFAYHADFDQILGAVIQLDPDDTSRDEPGELTYALPHVMRLALDHDNNPATAPQIFDDFNSLLNDSRNDARYGEGVLGEMYISTKRQGGRIYLVTNSVPLAGDYNKDLVVDAADYVVWRESVGESGYHLSADGNGDAMVDELDYAVWQRNFGALWPGTVSGGATAVPEPTASAVGCIIGLLWPLIAARSLRGRCRFGSDLR